MQEPMVSVTNLTRRYGSLTAVRDVSFTLRPGEILGLLGPNGAGKTTTLECLEGLKKPDEGQIRIAGIDPHQPDRPLHNIMGVQLQVSSLPDHILPAEIMRMTCHWHGVAYESSMLTRYGIDPRKRQTYYALSTGQKRRLHLALALACNPLVVVLDEPTAGLDVQGRAQLHEAIRTLKAQGVTILLATHDMAEAETLCDRIAILIRGQLATIDTPARITAKARQETKIRLRTTSGSLLPGQDRQHAVFLQQLEDYTVWQCHDVAAAVIELLHVVQQADDQVEDLRLEQPSLEEAFLSLIGGSA